MGRFNRKIQRGMRTSHKRKDKKKRFRKSGKFIKNLKKRFGREGSRR